MKVRISLKYIRNIKPKTLHPFWFTRDKSIYLNQETPIKEIDIDALNFENLAHISNGIIQGVISINNSKALEDAINKFRRPEAPPIEIQEPVIEEKTDTEEEHLDVHPKIEEIKELLTKSVKNVSKKIGSPVLNEQKELSFGISDRSYLLAVIEEENKSKTPRNGILKACKKRLNAIENCNGFMEEEEPEMEITEKDLRK